MAAGIAFRIWFFSAVLLAVGLSVYLTVSENSFEVRVLFICLLVSLVGSIPVLIALLIGIPIIRKLFKNFRKRFYAFAMFLFLLTLPYGVAAGVLNIMSHAFSFDSNTTGFFLSVVIACLLLNLSASIATAIVLPAIYSYFDYRSSDPRVFNNTFSQLFSHTIKPKKMETQQQFEPASQPSNKILIKGIITGALILLMLIPTVFIFNLIEEREARQKEVVAEVSSKWATAQTLSAPFLVVPYTDTFLNSEGKTVATKRQLILLANGLRVDGNIIPVERPRSIYKVLLYRSSVHMQGDFKVSWPADINIGNVDFAQAKLCFTLSDFKGIEEDIFINFGGQKMLMVPGLPVHDFGKVGLSVPVALTRETVAASIPFEMQVKIKGSEQLHFIPMSATSSFLLKSVWPDPSFDGDMLPTERQVGDSGFAARWNFNQANLPFARVMKSTSTTEVKMGFGVSLVQTADQYNKTMRSVKYAILFIGLTFAFFFIIELMQKKPFHPVQYVLVGLALVIFYSLLLSISEYIVFDYAYFIAALATILLISLYAQGHFRSWKTAGIFFLLLSCLYSFIFILISLEDTALLVGSIGLFMVLALVMFASRKINWYGNPEPVKNVGPVTNLNL